VTPFTGQVAGVVAAAKRIHAGLETKRLIPMPRDSREWDISPLTGAFLQDLTEISLERFGQDPLSAFDTPVVLLSSHPFACEVDLEDEVVFVSDTFLEALEFAAAQASIVNIIGKIKKFLLEAGNGADPLLQGIRQSGAALHSMYMTRMLLHVIGEKPAPAIAQVLPEQYKLFVHYQLAAAAIFALLHEQAHLEIKSGCLQPMLSVDLKDAFLNKNSSNDQIEEYACDHWAATQFMGSVRTSFVRAACFFFFNQWIVDYLLHNGESAHPPAFNRIQHLMLTLPEVKQEDIQFFNIMTKGLNSQGKLRDALNIRDQSQRYASILKYSRAGGNYKHYEEIVDSLSRSFEELGLEKSGLLRPPFGYKAKSIRLR